MTVRSQAWTGGLLLTLAALGIWMRDTQWQQAPADTLPLAMGLPAIALLGRPWRLADVANRVPLLAWLAGGLAFGFGWMGGVLTPMAFGWTILVGCWIKRCFIPLPGRGRLLWIALFSFPWLVVDWPMIGWGFRLSAAEFVTGVFKMLAMPVTRVGTNLEVVGMPVEVQEACAGWNLLQLCLLYGLATSAMELRRNSRFVVLLVILPVLAWLANAIRILLLAVIGLSWGTGVAAGPLHAPTALVVLILVMVATRLICGFLDPRQTIRRTVS